MTVKKHKTTVSDSRDAVTGRSANTADTAREASDWKDKYLRALADYQNLEKRTQEAFIERERRAGETVIRKLLPVADTLEMAEHSLNDPGLSLAVKELRAVFDDIGLVRLETVGKEFNPADMECIEVVEGTANRVIEESLPGYLLHGRLIRPAKVKVGGGENTGKK